MLKRLHEQIVFCEEGALLAHCMALDAASEELRREYRHIEKIWLSLADSLSFAKGVSERIQWMCLRVEPP